MNRLPRVQSITTGWQQEKVDPIAVTGPGMCASVEKMVCDVRQSSTDSVPSEYPIIGPGNGTAEHVALILVHNLPASIRAAGVCEMAVEVQAAGLCCRQWKRTPAVCYDHRAACCIGAHEVPGARQHPQRFSRQTINHPSCTVVRIQQQ